MNGVAPSSWMSIDKLENDIGLGARLCAAV